MKKILLTLFALTTVSSFAAGYNTYFKVGVDLHSKFKFSEDPDVKLPKKAKAGYSVFLENTYNFTDNFEAGLGVGFIYRKGKDFKKTIYDENDNAYILKGDMPAYNSIPLYLTAKYNFNKDSNFKPYIKVDLGYAINKEKYSLKYEGEEIVSLKAKNGLYTGIGLGFEYNNFLTELSYNLTKSKLKWDDGTKDKYNNTAVRLSVGYKFNF